MNFQCYFINFSSNFGGKKKTKQQNLHRRKHSPEEVLPLLFSPPMCCLFSICYTQANGFAICEALGSFERMENERGLSMFCPEPFLTQYQGMVVVICSKTELLKVAPLEYLHFLLLALSPGHGNGFLLFFLSKSLALNFLVGSLRKKKVFYTI